MLQESIREKALNYELEYSKAYGAEIIEHEDFIHIRNKFVNCAGDFNRAINLKFNDFNKFEEIINKITEIHDNNGLEKPSSYYVYPAKLDKSIWEEYLSSKGLILKENVCMIKEVSPVEIKSELLFINPDKQDFFKWYYEQEKSSSYFTQSWYDEMLPAVESFISEFKPFWLIDNAQIMGWVYCQFKDEICNVHDVFIKERYRGKGLARTMFNFVENETVKRGCKYINLFAFQNRKEFYEKIGFDLYEEISIIRHAQ